MERGSQLALVFAGLSVASAVSARLIPRGLAWSLFAGSVSLAIASLSLRFRACTAGALGLSAWVCALLSLLWGLAANLAARSDRNGGVQYSHRSALAAVTAVATLATGLGAAVAVLTILSMRIIYFTVALVSGSAGMAPPAYGFRPGGLGIIGLLAASTGLAAVRTRHGAFATVFYWLAIVFVTWTCFLGVVDAPPDSERFHTTVTLKLAAALVGVVAGTVLVEGWLHRRRRRRAAFSSDGNEMDPPVVFGGLRTSCGVVALGIMLLCCYHLVVPEGGGGQHCRLTAAIVAALAFVGGSALFFLVGRRWSVNLAEVAMALMSLGICAVAVITVPSRPMLLADRFPMIFNAMVVGLAVATWLWTWLATVWRRQLDDGAAWTTSGRLIPYAERFSFAAACLGLLLAAMMAIWPRLPRIAAMDHSLGRFAAGLCGNLLLLLVTLWCSRRLSWVTFHVLALLVVISTVGFVAVRIAPFTVAG